MKKLLSEIEALGQRIANDPSIIIEFIQIDIVALLAGFPLIVIWDKSIWPFIINIINGLGFKIFITFIIIFSIITIAYAVFAFAAKFFKFIRSTFIKLKPSKKLYIVGFLLSAPLATYLIAKGFDFAASNLFDGIIAGLIVVILTGVLMQEVFRERRNDEQLKQAKEILKGDDYNEPDSRWAIDVLKKLDTELHADSQYFLGTVYRDGKKYIQKNLQNASNLFERAAGKGHKQAAVALGEIYYEGQDHGKAIIWYRKIAKLGNAEAQFNLGTMHYLGRGVPQNSEKAFKWYKDAAEQGHAEAQFNISYMYSKGEGVNQDFDESSKWHSKWKEQVKAVAQDDFEVLYAKKVSEI